MWPCGTERKFHDAGYMAVRPGKQWQHQAMLGDALLPGWSLLSQWMGRCILCAVACSEALIFSGKTGAIGSGGRKLHSCEIERASGYCAGFTNSCLKGKGGTIQQHQQKRNDTLRSSFSVHTLAFILTAVSGDVAAEKYEPPWSFLEGYVMPPDVTKTFDGVRAACAYLNDRTLRGLSTAPPMAPDVFEVSAHSPNFLVEGVQSRRSAGVNVPLKAVPDGAGSSTTFRRCAGGRLSFSPGTTTARRP